MSQPPHQLDAPRQPRTPVELLRIADDERPRKRLRSGSPAVPPRADAIERDAVYYFEDGSTVVLVQNVLFKVCRSCANIVPS